MNFDLKLICLQGKEPLQLQERRFLHWYLSVMCIMALFSQVPQGKTEAFKWRAASSFSAMSGMYVYTHTHAYVGNTCFCIVYRFLSFCTAVASVQHLGEGGSVEAASPALPQAPGAPGTPMRVLTQLLGVEVRSSRDRAEGEEGSSPQACRATLGTCRAKPACRHPAGATVSNEVTVAGSWGWRIAGKPVGDGEQREGKFDTNVSDLLSKSP